MKPHVPPHPIILTLLLALFLSSTAYSQFNETAKLTASDAATTDFFGASVDISGNYAIVGAYGNDLPGSGSVAASGTPNPLGSVYIFQRSGGTWNEIQQFFPAYMYVPETGFGVSTAIEGDLAAAGAYYLDNIQDAVYVYKNDGGTWSHLIRLYEPVKGFGSDVDISGNRVIVGAPVGGEGSAFGQGRAFIYEYSGDPGYLGWTVVHELASSDAPAANFFGQNVAISGDYAAVSANGDINSLAGQAVFIFERDGSGNWNEVQKLTAPSASLNDGFGSSVSLDGDRLIVGSSFAQNGGVETGAVYVYERNGSGTWNLTSTLLASDGVFNDSFGWNADLKGDKVIVGTRYNDDDGTNSGSAYIFSYNGTTWTESGKYTASDAAENDNFGDDVAIDDYFAIAGAPGNDDAGSSSGSAYILQHQRFIPLLPRLILRVFPNPNQGRFFIGSALVKPSGEGEQLKMDFNQKEGTVKSNWEIIQTKAQITLTNAYGKELISRTIELPFLQLVDISRFGPGTYFVTVETEDMEKTVRVLVEK